MKKLPIFAAALLGIVAAGGAMAQGPGERERPSFEALDADGDGLVTQAELDAHRAARFAEVDTNGDGQIDLEEFTARAEGRAVDRAERMFGRMDADGDGRLSRDALEGRQRGGDMITALDENGDGALDSEEFAMMRDKMAERWSKRHGQRGN